MEKDLTYWRNRPPDPDSEWVGRTVRNAFDVDETLVLQAKHWRHFDWLEQQGSDMEQWVKDADIGRHKKWYSLSLSGEMQYSLYLSLRKNSKRRDNGI